MTPLAFDLRRVYSGMIATDGLCTPLTTFSLALGFWALTIWLLVHMILTQNSAHLLPVPFIILLGLSLYFSAWFISGKWRRKLLREVFFLGLRLPWKEVITWPHRFLKTGALVFCSKFAVVRKPKYRGQNESSAPLQYHGHLCQTCDELISKSRLFTGSSLFPHLVSPIEIWPHQANSLAGLQASALVCHLCSLLLKSISRQATIPSGALKLKVWEARSLRHPVPELKMQLYGDCIKAASPLTVQEIHGPSKVGLLQGLVGPHIHTHTNTFHPSIDSIAQSNRRDFIY